MKKLLIVVILLLLGGGGYYAYVKYGKTEDKATVSQAAIQQGNIVQMVQATGTLEALRTVQVGSQVSGTVKNLYVDYNSIVKKDQIIAELDDSLLKVQVDVQQAAIARQQSDIDNQKVQLENDQLNLTRTQNQFKAGLSSQQQLEQAQLAVKNRQAQITSAEKQIVQSEAALHQAELNVSYCTVRSPIDGVVVNRLVDIGQTVQASMQTPQFFTIATDLTTLKLSASVDEAEIGYLRPNMLVNFTVDAYGTQQFRGSVDAVRLNAQVQNNVVTYPVWITVLNPDLKLRPSMTANVRIVVDQANNVLRIPNQALRFRPTSDIYTWLGMTPPAAGRGRGANANAGYRQGGGQGANATAQNVPGAPGQAAVGQQANAQAGADQNAQGGGRRRRQQQDQAAAAAPGTAATKGAPATPDAARQGGGQGGGRGAGGFGRGGANLTPEQIAQFRQRFGGAGGQGGGRGGGRNGQGYQGGQGGQFGGRRNGGQPQAASDVAPLHSRGADKIDELFEPVPKRIQPGQVWLYDDKSTDPNKKLRQVSVRVGLTDGQYSELVSAGEDLKPGTMVVTGVTPPPSALPKAGQSNIFQQQRGGFGPPPGGGGPRGGRGGD